MRGPRREVNIPTPAWFVRNSKLMCLWGSPCNQKNGPAGALDIILWVPRALCSLALNVFSPAVCLLAPDDQHTSNGETIPAEVNTGFNPRATTLSLSGKTVNVGTGASSPITGLMYKWAIVVWSDCLSKATCTSEDLEKYWKKTHGKLSSHAKPSLKIILFPCLLFASLFRSTSCCQRRKSLEASLLL